jgi:hypothetical protein
MAACNRDDVISEPAVTAEPIEVLPTRRNRDAAVFKANRYS